MHWNYNSIARVLFYKLFNQHCEHSSIVLNLPFNICMCLLSTIFVRSYDLAITTLIMGLFCQRFHINSFGAFQQYTNIFTSYYFGKCQFQRLTVINVHPCSLVLPVRISYDQILMNWCPSSAASPDCFRHIDNDWAYIFLLDTLEVVLSSCMHSLKNKDWVAHGFC